MGDYKFITWGGLGDTLLMTPLFKHLYEQGIKVRVLASNKKHFSVLLNNPYIQLDLLKGDIKSINIKDYIRPCYANLLPSLFFKDINASVLMAKMLNINLSDTKPVIVLKNKEIQEAKKILKNNSIDKFIAINPFTDDNPNKEWDVNRWEELVNTLHDKGKKIIQLGREDHPKINGVDLSPKSSIRLSLALLYLSEKFVGIDSFLSHAATALNVKSIILFGPTTPVVWGHIENINIYNKVSCSPCVDILFRLKCPFGKKCMKSITIEKILQNFTDL